jgi:hypothetical protein
VSINRPAKALRHSGLGLLVVLAACASDSDPAPQQVAELVAPTSTAPTTIDVTTTTAPPIPPQHLTSCVENAKFQAFTGNEFWASMWADAGMTDGGMRAVCVFLAQDDPGVLADIDRDWVALQMATGSTATTTADGEAPLDPGPAEADLVDACVDWVEYNRLVGVPRALDLWENLGGSVTALRGVCVGIARDNPAEAETMRDELAGVDDP